MTENSDIISIENVTYGEVKSLLLTEYGLDVQEDKTCQFLGINFDIFDLTEEYEYAREFLKKEGLQEEHPFYREFDMSDFNVVVGIWAQPWRPSNNFKLIIADQIGMHISIKLKTRVVISFENGEIPFCVYDKGVKVKDIKECYEDYLKSKPWQPTEFTKSG